MARHAVASPRVQARLKVLQPADLPLRGGRGYQALRRTSLVIAWALIAGVPLLEATRLSSTPPVIVGAPTSIALGPIDFVDPTVAAGVFLTGGGTWAVVAGMAVPLVLVLIFGRFFCSWICPYVAVLAASNAARALLARLGMTPSDVLLPRRSNLASLALLLVTSLIAGSQLIVLFYPPAIIGREVWRLVYFGSLGGGAVLLAACFVLDTFVARAGTCRYLCPGGAMFSLLGRWSPFRVIRHAAKCTDCTLCDLVCNMRQAPMTDGVDGGCDRCGRCVSVCPTKALRIGRETK